MQLCLNTYLNVICGEGSSLLQTSLWWEKHTDFSCT